MGIAPGPAKRYSAAQVSRLVGVKPHVLRYWEAKFGISPERNSAGRRIYTLEQVQKMKRIKFLRYQERLTIQGARQKLPKLTRIADGRALPQDARATLLWIKQELSAIRDLLSEDV